MADEFNRKAFANWLVEAGTVPEAAAAYAGLFEAFVANAFATRAHISALEIQVAELRSEIAVEASKLLPRQLFFDTMRKQNYRAYLEHMQFGIALAVYGTIAAILLAILYKLW